MSPAVRPVGNFKDFGCAGATTKPLILLGAAERIRTSDPRITNALLYRLSYRGVHDSGCSVSEMLADCHPSAQSKCFVSACNIAKTDRFRAQRSLEPPTAAPGATVSASGRSAVGESM